MAVAGKTTPSEQPMSLKLISPSAIEPISLGDAKAHLRVDTSDEDAYIGRLIEVARIIVERTLGRALINQSWAYYLDAWPEGRYIAIPLPPLQSVDVVTVYDKDDQAQILSTDLYGVDLYTEPGRLVRKGNGVWTAPGRPSSGIEIQFTAGFGAVETDVPAPLRQAILVSVAHWFETREPLETLDGNALPHTVEALLASYRRVRL